MASFKQRVEKIRSWLVENLPWIGKLLLILLVAGLSVVVIGAQRAHIVALVQARPVLTTVATGLACLLAGLLLSWRTRDPASWTKYRDPALITLVTLLALGCGGYLISAASFYADEVLKVAAVRAATGWGLGYFAGGFLIGFLFGVPRVQQGDGVNAPPSTPGVPPGSPTNSYRQLVNTNLEQISDWLTKIIVGLGLVELKTMPERLHRAALWMAKSLSNKEGAALEQAASFACGFIIFFTVVGFMAGYLLTRLYLSGAFGRADRDQIPTAFTPPATYTPDTVGDAARIRTFWKPNNVLDSAHEEALNAWLNRKRIEVSLTAFLESGEYASQRSEMIKELRIP